MTNRPKLANCMRRDFARETIECLLKIEWNRSLTARVEMNVLCVPYERQQLTDSKQTLQRTIAALYTYSSWEYGHVSWCQRKCNLNIVTNWFELTHTTISCQWRNLCTFYFALEKNVYHRRELNCFCSMPTSMLIEFLLEIPWFSSRFRTKKSS